MFLLLTILLVGTLLYLARHGRLGPLAFSGGRSAPEYEAKQVLAERFARGEISTDEFLERASVLNWTPGSDSMPPQRKRKTKR